MIPRRAVEKEKSLTDLEKLKKRYIKEIKIYIKEKDSYLKTAQRLPDKIIRMFEKRKCDYTKDTG